MKNSKTEINQDIDRLRHYASKSGCDAIDWCEVYLKRYIESLKKES